MSQFTKWSLEMDRAASAMESASDGSPGFFRVIDGNRAIAEVLRQGAAIESKLASLISAVDHALLEYGKSRGRIVPSMERLAEVLAAAAEPAHDSEVAEYATLRHERDAAIARAEAAEAKTEKLLEAAKAVLAIDVLMRNAQNGMPAHVFNGVLESLQEEAIPALRAEVARVEGKP